MVAVTSGHWVGCFIHHRRNDQSIAHAEEVSPARSLSGFECISPRLRQQHPPEKKPGRRKEHLESFSRFEFADANWKNRTTSAARHSQNHPAKKGFRAIGVSPRKPL